MASVPTFVRGNNHPYFLLLRFVQSLLLSAVVALFIVTFIFQAFQIPSGSMESTLMTGDYLLVDKSLYAAGDSALFPTRDVARGDIVVFHYPLEPQTYFVKRVVAVPGDRVRIINKRLYVNGRAELAAYAIHRDQWFDAYRDNFPELHFAPSNVDARWWSDLHHLTSPAGDLVVPAGSYFVLGDNRDDSQDSRYWGFVPRANIIGRPLLIYWSRSNAPVPGVGVASARGDTLSGLAYAMTHLHTRWDRMLRVVR
jgi:signal peptidase I